MIIRVLPRFYLITDKSEVSSISYNFYHTIETLLHTKVAILWSDNGREFQNHNLCEFLAFKRIIHQYSWAYTLQQNWVAEWKIYHLLDVTHSLMLYIYLPSSLYGDAILTTTYLINRITSRILHIRTFLDCLIKKYYFCTCLISEVPLHVFGCTTYVHNVDPN